MDPPLEAIPGSEDDLDEDIDRVSVVVNEEGEEQPADEDDYNSRVRLTPRNTPSDAPSDQYDHRIHVVESDASDKAGVRAI